MFKLIVGILVTGALVGGGALLWNAGNTATPQGVAENADVAPDKPALTAIQKAAKEREFTAGKAVAVDAEALHPNAPVSKVDYLREQLLTQVEPADAKTMTAFKESLDLMAKRGTSGELALLQEVSVKAASRELREYAADLYRKSESQGRDALAARAVEKEKMKERMAEIEKLQREKEAKAAEQK